MPVVDRFSSPKEILPPESVIDPSAKVILPREDTDSAGSGQGVERFSSPKDIAPPSSVIVPLSKVKLPTEIIPSAARAVGIPHSPEPSPSDIHD